MQFIQPVLICSVLVILVIAFRYRSTAHFRAGSKLILLVLGALAIAAVAEPQIAQVAAENLGVSRGTDLVLYVLVVVFAFITLAFHFRVREVNTRLQKLTRQLALAEAVTMAGAPGAAAVSSTVPGVETTEPAVPPPDSEEPGRSA